LDDYRSGYSDLKKTIVLTGDKIGFRIESSQTLSDSSSEDNPFGIGNIGTDNNDKDDFNLLDDDMGDNTDIEKKTLLHTSDFHHLAGLSDFSNPKTFLSLSSSPHLSPFSFFRELITFHDFLFKYNRSKTTTTIIAGLYFTSFLDFILSNYELVIILGFESEQLNMFPEFIRERYDLLCSFTWLLKNVDFNLLIDYINRLDGEKQEKIFLLVKICMDFFSPPSLYLYLRLRNQSFENYSRFDSGVFSVSSEISIESNDISLENKPFSSNYMYKFKLPQFPNDPLSSIVSLDQPFQPVSVILTPSYSSVFSSKDLVNLENNHNTHEFKVKIYKSLLKVNSSSFFCFSKNQLIQIKRFFFFSVFY
jgi:hypothetical protein